MSLDSLVAKCLPWIDKFKFGRRKGIA